MKKFGSCLLAFAAFSLGAVPGAGHATGNDRDLNIVLAGARWLKASMKKPETFELLRATMIDGKVICYEYRARNSWNDRSPGTYVISDSVSSSKPKEWNKYCAGKSGIDYTSVRAVM